MTPIINGYGVSGVYFKRRKRPPVNRVSPRRTTRPWTSWNRHSQPSGGRRWAVFEKLLKAQVGVNRSKFHDSYIKYAL
jgi:hypothetical protein